MESPDILIGIDMQAASAQTWPNTKNFVSNLVEKLSEFFRFGGCLDEVRLGIFQVRYFKVARHFGKELFVDSRAKNILKIPVQTNLENLVLRNVIPYSHFC